MSQIPLALRLGRRSLLDDFVAGANAAALGHVRAIASGQRREAVWLAGAAGSGKSHLLAGACRAASEAGLRSMYLAIDAAADPSVLRELDAVAVLAIDDVHLAAGNADWEQALFVALDARLDGGGLLLAAEGAPRDCGFVLPDLRSRATAAAVYRLAALDDEGLALAVTQRAAQMGLALDGPAASYLLQRVSRDPGVLADWLERIDRFSLAEQRRITIPLLREVLAGAARESG